MRKICLLLTILGAFSCSVDQDELGLENNQILEANAVIEVEGCEVSTYNFGDAGIVEVTNDNEGTLFVTIKANEGYDLDKTRLHVINASDDFPTVGQGNLPPSRMEWVESFDLGVDHYTFEIDLANYGPNLSVASFSTFTGEGGSNSYWAGDFNVKYGNWAYFNYDVQLCEVFEDPCNYIQGEEYSTSLSFEEVTDGRFPSEVSIRDFYFALIEEDGITNKGTFSPSIAAVRDEWDIIKKDISNFPYDLTTIYTVSKGDCTDSVRLTLTITP